MQIHKFPKKDTDMKAISRTALLIFTAGFLASCEESRQKATEQLNDLNQKTEELHTVLDAGLQKIESLDSVVRSGADQIKEYDSLVTRSTSRLDSIAKEKAKAWEELTTF